MVARVRPIQNVRFLTTVPAHVHRGIPMAERCLTAVNTVMAMHVINLVRHIHLVGTHIPPVVMHIIQTVVHILQHVQHIVIPNQTQLFKIHQQKQKVVCPAARDAVHRAAHHAAKHVAHRVRKHAVLHVLMPVT